jgi:uncharacterized glyoxalase superfamily protein PhnB
VIPILTYVDAAKAIAFLSDAFGFEEGFRSDDGEIVHHAEMWWDHSALMITSAPVSSDAAGAEVKESWTYVVVPDPDEHCRRAAAAGATIVQPVRDGPHESRVYRATDTEGHLWTFSSHSPVMSSEV